MKEGDLVKVQPWEGVIYGVGRGQIPKEWFDTHQVLIDIDDMSHGTVWRIHRGSLDPTDHRYWYIPECQITVVSEKKTGKCTCGGWKVKDAGHSDWCDL